MERLKDKTAMVVGAGSIGPGWGNGKATAAIFAREGAQVFCVDRNAAAAEETVGIIKGEGGDATAFTADVSRASEVEAMVEACLKAYGRIDVLDNNVGIAEMGSVVEVTESEWDRVFAVNLKSAFLAMKHVVPVMQKQGGGAIVMINSLVTRKPMPYQGGYAMSKAALTAATAQLALELGRYGIRVNSAYMGWMMGPPVEGYLRDAAGKQGTTVEAMAKGIARSIPLGRIPDDADCAKAALFLASDYACVVTGAALDVNGGEFLPR